MIVLKIIGVILLVMMALSLIFHLLWGVGLLLDWILKALTGKNWEEHQKKLNLAPIEEPSGVVLFWMWAFMVAVVVGAVLWLKF